MVLNPKVDTYFREGCGRCDLYQTPQCKVHPWAEGLKSLRTILVGTELTEELKWGVPTYTFQSKNILILSAFKNFFSLSFFKGVLIPDPKELLEFAGPNSREAKLLKFTSTEMVRNYEEDILRFIEEALEIERKGLKVPKSDNAEDFPEELNQAFREDAGFKAAFTALSPGRQRGYLLHFKGAKQSATRLNRIAKWKNHILKGKGIHDK